jgi:hypothetical protein
MKSDPARENAHSPQITDCTAPAGLPTMSVSKVLSDEGEAAGVSVLTVGGSRLDGLVSISSYFPGSPRRIVRCCRRHDLTDVSGAPQSVLPTLQHGDGHANGSYGSDRWITSPSESGCPWRDVPDR